MPGADVDGVLRSGVASLCLTAGVLHVSAAADHGGMAAHVAFFMAVAVAQSALAAGLVRGRRPGRTLAVSAVVNVAVAFVWVLSRTTGLHVDGTSAAEAIGFKDGITTMLEIGAAAGAGLWWLLPDTALSALLPSRRLASTLLGTGVWAIGAAGLFAGHTHSPGHTHAGEHAHATRAPDGAEHEHAPDPGHPGDHAHPSDVALADGPTAPEHTHAVTTAATGGPHDPADHHHETVEGTTPQPVPGRAAAHRHEPIAAVAGQDDAGHDHDSGGDGHRHDGESGGDHHHPDDDHSHDHDAGGSGDGTGDGDGGTSPLDDVLKLIRPR